MIIFDLNCTHGHRFEGWFASAEEFDRQRDAALVVCPICDDAHVERLPSAKVRVPRAAARDNAPTPQPEAEARPEHGEMTTVSPEVLAKLREVVRSTENVGRRFAEEARKIHYGETDARGIYGEATLEEAKSLADDGVDFMPIPVFPDDRN